jgi:hypothetical protein
MEAYKRLLNVTVKPLTVSKINGAIAVAFLDCEVKDGMFLKTIYGLGLTFEEACEDYLAQISGHTLIFDAYTKDRKAVPVL